MMYLIKNKDGTVSVMIMLDGKDPQAEIDKWHTDLKNKVESFQQITENELPLDRTFRNAWTISGGKVVHDMAKAREIHKNRMREARKPKFDDLDVQFMRAQEAGQDTKAIVLKKQQLRDVTADPRIAAAQTPEELKTVWPDSLK